MDTLAVTLVGYTPEVRHRSWSPLLGPKLSRVVGPNDVRFLTGVIEGRFIRINSHGLLFYLRFNTWSLKKKPSTKSKKNQGSLVAILSHWTAWQHRIPESTGSPDRKSSISLSYWWKLAPWSWDVFFCQRRSGFRMSLLRFWIIIIIIIIIIIVIIIMLVSAHKLDPKFKLPFFGFYSSRFKVA